MENFTLISLIENLRPLMTDVIIRRVVQHQPNGFIFQTRAIKIPAFKILLEPKNPALYISEARLPFESPNSDFLMVLRKYLTSAELVEFRKPLSERIVEFQFKTVVPSKELEKIWLVIELIPNAPNLMLLDAERRVLSTFIPISPQHGIGEYEVYVYPQVPDKLKLEQILEEETGSVDRLDSWEDPGPDPRARLISSVAGLGPVFAAEILHRQRKKNGPLSEEIRSMLGQLKTVSRSAWLYTSLPLGHILEQNDLERLNKAILSPIELESLQRTHSSRVFGGIQEAAKFYFDELESRILLEEAKLPVLRDLRAAARRIADREKRLLREQQRYEETEDLQKKAQMLTSSGMNMDRHYDSLEVTDYFGDKPQKIRIPLDSTISLRENVEKMFKRRQKATRGKDIVAGQLSRVRNRLSMVDEQLRRLRVIKDWDTWLAIANKIDTHRRIGETEPAGSERPTRRFRQAAIDDREVLIGRSSRENDELTFHAAAPDDFWFHVADYSGSHVVVRNPGREKDLNESVLVKAAQLAAYFSQARNSSKVEVHYTKRKHVTKPKRAKPGLVRLLEFKAITVEPKNWL